MGSYLWRLVGALVVCAILVPLAFYVFGAVGLVFVAPVIGVAFSRLVIDGTAEMGWRMRSSVLAPLSGKHYVYMGFNLRIVEDEDYGRWMAMADVRRIVGNAATDKAVAKTYPGGWQVFENRGYLRDDALLHYLGREPSSEAVKLRNWAERNIAFPARTTRKRQGIILRDPMQLPLADD